MLFFIPGHLVPPSWASLAPTHALDSKKEMSHADHWRLPSTHSWLLQTNKAKEMQGGWAQGDSVTLISSACPLLGFLGSEPAGNHCHINPSSMGPELGLESDMALQPGMDMGNVAALLVSWCHRKGGALAERGHMVKKKKKITWSDSSGSFLTEAAEQ